MNDTHKELLVVRDSLRKQHREWEDQVKGLRRFVPNSDVALIPEVSYWADGGDKYEEISSGEIPPFLEISASSFYGNNYINVSDKFLETVESIQEECQPLLEQLQKVNKDLTEVKKTIFEIEQELLFVSEDFEVSFHD